MSYRVKPESRQPGKRIMNWTEFREFVALAAVGIETAAAVVLTCLLLLMISGAAIGVTAGAASLVFQAVTGACK